MKFVAIDVETANPDMASICQIGIAKFVNGTLVQEWSSLIDPEDYFDPINVDIHGIDERAVSGSPRFVDVLDPLTGFLEKSVCVSHTHFDRVSVGLALKRNSQSEIESTWLDSAKVARRVWKECAWKGYGLSNVCSMIGYDFNHHDALEDAKAAGHVIIAALNELDADLDFLLERVKQPIDPRNCSTGAFIKRDGNPEGDLHGNTLVFTGALTIARHEAADLAAKVGCSVAAGVSKKTTILVVGDQDVTKLAGKTKSSKHLKAEVLIGKGQKLRIVRESDFMKLVEYSH